AAEAGVDPARIVFSTFFEERFHVAAKGTCDLFLDAHPYSAHGTAADALFAGLPMLNFPSDTMVSRVGASLAFASPQGTLLTARTFGEYLTIAHHLIGTKKGAAALAQYRKSLEW
ncbi:hypothetical protein T484DRAFT_1771306, partial [Baffinella frigidus]